MIDQIDSKDFRALIDTLAFLPQFATDTGRRQLVDDALRDFTNARRLGITVNFQGDADVVANEVIRRLTSYGQVQKDREALGVFLQYILNTYLGEGRDANFLYGLIDRYHLLPLTAEVQAVTETAATVPPAAGIPYIFISYARPNAEVAAKVQAAVTRAGYGVFRDVKDIRSGSNWVDTIDEALRKATHMVLLLSNYSMPYRKEVQNEWFYFDNHGKPILPLYLEDCVLHSRLEAMNWIDARTNLDSAIVQVVSQIQTR